MSRNGVHVIDFQGKIEAGATPWLLTLSGNIALW